MFIATLFIIAQTGNSDSVSTDIKFSKTSQVSHVCLRESSHETRRFSTDSSSIISYLFLASLKWLRSESHIFNLLKRALCVTEYSDLFIFLWYQQKVVKAYFLDSEYLSFSVFYNLERLGIFWTIKSCFSFNNCPLIYLFFFTFYSKPQKEIRLEH